MLHAFFNSAADPAMDGNILLTPPILRLTSDEQKKQITELDQTIASAQAGIRESIKSLKYVDPATVQPPPPVQTSELVWFEDAFPAGAISCRSGWRTDRVRRKGQRTRVQWHCCTVQRTADGCGAGFLSPAGGKFEIPPNGKLSVQCFIDEKNPPKAVMLQFHTAGWNHRAVWGEEGAIPFGKVRTPERVMMGKLPEFGKWVKLEVPVEKIGLKPGMKVTGYAFTQFAGTVYWDRLAMNSRVDPAKDPQWSWTVWTQKNQGKRVAELPNDLQALVRGKKPAEWPEKDVKRLQEWWFENEYQGARDLLGGARAEKLAAEAKKSALDAVIPATFVMADLPEKRESFGDGPRSV